MKIQNKNVVVTGGSSGIGLKLVETFLEEGCKVVAGSRTIESSDINHDRLFKKNCDVSKKEELDQLFKFAVEKLSGIDIFVANAGFAYYEKIEKPDWGHIQKIFDTNTISVIYSAGKMKELYPKKPYNFVCVASAIGLLSIPGFAIYSGTKAALSGFADAYRYELENQQKFQVVYPISTKTSFFKSSWDVSPPPPVQDVETVTKSILKGIRKDKNRIFPSKAFYIMNTFFPFLNKIYVNKENKKFHQWQKER
ncbi:MAG: SDR family NAD(P)-dependent oxidoreductase [Thermoplasmata archaeon]